MSCRITWLQPLKQVRVWKTQRKCLYIALVPVMAAGVVHGRDVLALRWPVPVVIQFQ
jgi:hypothetical protein